MKSMLSAETALYPSFIPIALLHTPCVSHFSNLAIANFLGSCFLRSGATWAYLWELTVPGSRRPRTESYSCQPGQSQHGSNAWE
jgi:hypothetical protein